MNAPFKTTPCTFSAAAISPGALAQWGDTRRRASNCAKCWRLMRASGSRTYTWRFFRHWKGWWRMRAFRLKGHTL